MVDVSKVTDIVIDRIQDTVIDSIFRKTLPDLVRGFRNAKNNEEYVNRCLQEIRQELKQSNRSKTIAVQKLAYLHMIGYEISWAAFNVLEVISQPQFFAKRIGYLAASFAFTFQPDVIMLTTNLFKKDLTSANPYETAVSVNCLSNVCTPDLAREIAPDILGLLGHSRPYIRKKVILVLYKIFLKYPQALRPAFPRLKEKLEDSDPGVVCAAVSVICELARKNPKNYLSLAPVLFKLLTISDNNWILVKIVKLFGCLAGLEPRLAKKLSEPLSNLMQRTTSVALLYECIQACISGLSAYPNVIKICINKSELLVQDTNQNLKYLGLLSFSKLMIITPAAVREHRDIVIKCLDDDDISIRLRALDLIQVMVSKRNLADIVKKLADKLHTCTEDSYRDVLIEKIVLISTQNNYALITDFEWYISVLQQLARVPYTKLGKLISDQFMDVCIRVKVIRPYGVVSMISLLSDERFVESAPQTGVTEVLYAASWIIGEFVEYASDHCKVLEILLQPRNIALPGHIQSVQIQNITKIFIYLAHQAYLQPQNSEQTQPFQQALSLIKSNLNRFTRSADLETQERACFLSSLIQTLESDWNSTGAELILELAKVFSEPLNPVAERAQRKVPIPPGLQEPLYESSSESESEDEFSGPYWKIEQQIKTPEAIIPNIAATQAASQQRRQDPYYLGSKVDLEKEPEAISYERPVQVPQNSQKNKHYHVLDVNEMPEGSAPDTPEDSHETSSDPLAMIDLTQNSEPATEPSQRKSHKRRHKTSSKSTGVLSEQQNQSEQEIKSRPSSKPNVTPGFPDSPQVRPITQDSFISLGYEIMISHQQPDKFVLVLCVKSLAHKIRRLEFAFSEQTSSKLLPPVELAINGSLHSATTTSQRYLFQNQSFTDPIRVEGSLSYKYRKTENRLGFSFVIPFSWFIVPHKISLEQFLAISISLRSYGVQIPVQDARKALHQISSLLHVSQVKVTDVAMLYGCTTLGQHVCVLVKNLHGSLDIELKCSDDHLSTSLVSEISSAFSSAAV